MLPPLGNERVFTSLSLMSSHCSFVRVGMLKLNVPIVVDLLVAFKFSFLSSVYPDKLKSSFVEIARDVVPLKSSSRRFQSPLESRDLRLNCLMPFQYDIALIEFEVNSTLESIALYETLVFTLGLKKKRYLVVVKLMTSAVAMLDSRVCSNLAEDVPLLRSEMISL